MMSEITITIEIDGHKNTLTVSSARKLWEELGLLFGSGHVVSYPVGARPAPFDPMLIKYKAGDVLK